MNPPAGSHQAAPPASIGPTSPSLLTSNRGEHRFKAREGYPTVQQELACVSQRTSLPLATSGTIQTPPRQSSKRMNSSLGHSGYKASTAYSDLDCCVLYPSTNPKFSIASLACSMPLARSSGLKTTCREAGYSMSSLGGGDKGGYGSRREYPLPVCVST